MITLVCSTDAGYLPRIRPYLDSLARHLAGTPIVPVCVTVNSDPPGDLPVRAARQDTAGLPYPPPLNHLQAGGFLDAVPGADDDVLIFTDGDIVMQRQPTPIEVEWLATWPAGVVGLGFNAGPLDSLLTEGQRLLPRFEPEAETLGLWAAVPCYNTGVVVARRATWRAWYAKTAEVWPEAERHFQHYARQQWAMCLARALLGLPVLHLPQTIHTHGCYALPHGCHVQAGALWYLEQPVLLRHHI